MKYLCMLAFVGFVAVTPVYLYQTQVVPQLNAVADQYRSYDQVAQDVVNAPTPKNY